jgi:hypothetical protein
LQIVLLTGATILVFDGCSHGGSNTTIVGLDWKPENVRIRCAAADICPVGVGAIFGRRLVDLAGGRKAFELYRCTTSVIAPTQIISNGHCDPFDHGFNEAFAITYNGSGTEVHPISRSLFSESNEKDFDSPDISILELATPVQATGHFRISRQFKPELSDLNAYVMNADDGRFGAQLLKIDNVRCKVHEYTTFFPFGLLEKPETESSMGCLVVPGNSGSPVFSTKDTTTIEGLLYAVHLPSPAQYDLTTKDYTPAMPFFTLSTSLACANLPNQPPGESSCTSTHGLDSVTRARRLNRAGLQELAMQWIRGQDDAEPFFRTPLFIPMRDHPSPLGASYYAFPVPRCFRGSQPVEGLQNLPVIAYEPISDGYGHMAYNPVHKVQVDFTLSLTPSGYVYQLMNSFIESRLREQLDLKGSPNSGPQRFDLLEQGEYVDLPKCTGYEKAQQLDLSLPL